MTTAVSQTVKEATSRLTGPAAVYATTCAGQRNRTVGAMSNMTPGFKFQQSGEILWCHVRGRLQQILQFDEEWVIDTPRSETLWSETCQQNDIARGSAAALKTVRATSGLIGFTWWGWYLPQHVDLLAVDPAGMYRLRCSTVLGRPRPDAGEQLWLLLDGFRACVPIQVAR